MRLVTRFVAALAASFLAVAPTVARPAVVDGPDHARLASAFLERHGLGDASPATLDVGQLLRTDFLRTEVGLFDLYIDATALEADHVEQYRRIVAALFAAQSSWLDWLAPESDVGDARKALKKLLKWAESWDEKDLLAAAKEGVRDPYAATGAKKDVVQAARELADFMARGEALGLGRTEGVREPIVLVPGRRDFLEFLSFGGWLHPHLRTTFWRPDVVTWTHFYLDDIKVLAMQYANTSAPGSYTSGRSMDYRTPTGLEQQITQLAMNSMIASYYGDRVPPTLAGAMAVNLVIDVYGECNTRVDGDLRARRTAAREVFVPGGNPNGGILPPNLADSRWREGQGGDHFVRVLRQATTKKTKGRRNGSPGAFELLDDRETDRMVVEAPFLGASAALRPALPEDYYGDSLEFLRAYRSCFLYWLQEKGDGSSRSSASAFARLLQNLAANDDPEAIEQVIVETYDGMALSGPEPGRKDLEGRFLAWLAKQR